MICMENNNNNYEDDFASFATCQFSTLKMISSCLEDVVSLTLDIKRYVCMKTYLHNFSRDFSSSLAIEMYGLPFFPCHPYIESTTVLSDYTTSKLWVLPHYYHYILKGWEG